MEKYILQYLHKEGKTDFDRRSLELIISPRCNLGCKYCYIHKYRKDIFGEDCFNEENTIKNLKLILKWLEKNNYNPNFEIFSGELFAQEIGFKVLETIYEHEKNIDSKLRPDSISIPTNFTFISSDELTEKINNIRQKFSDIGIQICLSASFDGKYMEQNRPYIGDLDIPLNCNRDDEYYDKVFSYVKEHCDGLHPMLYSKHIEDWKKNFLWFQEQMEKHDIPWDSIYLLQVRNEEWTQEQVLSLCDFVEFLFDYSWEKLGKDKDKLFHFITKGRGFNILSQMIGKTSRGLNCAIQTCLPIRVSDLMVYPCHRLGYKDFYYGQFIPDDEQILKYENKNVELMTAIFSVHKEALPYCTSCVVNKLCSGPCIGAQYESNKNMFVPIPTVCAMTHGLAFTIVKCLKKYDIFHKALNILDDTTIAQFQYLEGVIENNAK